MNTLFEYKASALMAAGDDDYVRLEIHVGKPHERQLEQLFCKQIKVWLPIGNTEGSISASDPIPFSSDARWMPGNGEVISTEKVAAGEANQSMRTYFFDDSAQGCKPVEAHTFTIGFRIEKAKLKALKALTVHLEEISYLKKTGGSTDTFCARKTKVIPSLEFIQPTIQYFIATKYNKPCKPCTVFSRHDAIKLKWAGNLVDAYTLYVGDEEIVKGEHLAHELLDGIDRDTSIILEGIGKIGTEEVATYQTLNITIKDPILESLKVVGDVGLGRVVLPVADILDVQGDQATVKITGKTNAFVMLASKHERAHIWSIAAKLDGILQFYDHTSKDVRMAIDANGNIGVGPRWDGVPIQVILGKPDHSGSWGDGAAFFRFEDNVEDGVNKGTSIAINTHKFNGGTNESMRIAADGSVGIGTAKPFNKLSFGNIQEPRKIALFENENGANVYGLGFSKDPWITSILANGERALNVDYKGNVGIGTTDPAGHKLKVDGSLNGLNGVFIENLVKGGLDKKVFNQARWEDVPNSCKTCLEVPAGTAVITWSMSCHTDSNACYFSIQPVIGIRAGGEVNGHIKQKEVHNAYSGSWITTITSEQAGAVDVKLQVKHRSGNTVVNENDHVTWTMIVFRS